MVDTQSSEHVSSDDFSVKKTIDTRSQSLKGKQSTLDTILMGN